MKAKITIVLGLLAIFNILHAQIIQVAPKWQLIGAVEDINVSKFDGKCVNFIWKYSSNDGWKLHIANDNSYDTSSNFTIFNDVINKGEGFWIKGNDSNCTITTLNHIFNEPIASQDLISGWKEELIYAADIIFPRQVVIDENENIYITVQIGEKFKIFLFNDDNTTSLFLEITDRVQGFSYQANLKRFIYTTDNGSLYSIDKSTKKITKLQGEGSVNGNNIASENNGGFYTCSGAPNGLGLYHFDSNGKFLETLVDEVKVCTGILLSKDEKKLYYSSGYDGALYSYDLNEKKVNTLITDIGIPGTFEPIVIAFDDNEKLYVAPSGDGLFLYDTASGNLTKILDTIGGGTLKYSQKRDGFIAASHSTSNIIFYDVKNKLSTQLTPINNAFSIIRTSNNLILSCRNEQRIDTISKNGYELFMDLTGIGSCDHLSLDANENIYAVLSNQVVKINPTNKTYTQIYNSDYQIVNMDYNKEDNSLIIVVNIDNSSVEIRKVPLDGSIITKITTITDVKVGNVLPGIACDYSSNCYILERKHNKILKLNLKTKELTDFFTNPLEHDAITNPDMIYVPELNSLVISNIEDYQMINLDTKEKKLFAKNKDSVDSLSLHYLYPGVITTTHSGRVFSFVKE